MISFDVAVLGAGTMGSAVADHLSRRGLRVAAFEQFGIVHEMGSHGGSTRIIRHAYHESPDYVPLVLRSDDLWLELEAATGSRLLIRTGGIDLGPQNGTVVRNALLACRTHNRPGEQLSAAEVVKRWPQFRVPDEWHACYDPQMGFLLVESCIRAHVDSARNLGATILENEPVLSIDYGQTIRLKTHRSVYEAAYVVVCAGSWTGKFLSELNLPLVVKRKTLSWMKVNTPEDFAVGRFPIFLTDTPAGLLYGFPLFGHPGLKIANHHAAGPPVHPDTVDREFCDEDANDVREFTARHLPAVTSIVLDGKVCLYTMTPDEHFLIDLHPQHRNVVIAGGFSGHGFKFAPVVGEIVADLITAGKTKHRIDKFRISRF